MAPSGWPCAMAPPHGLTFTGSARVCAHATRHAANASFTSIQSRSASMIGPRVRAPAVAGITPVELHHRVGADHHPRAETRPGPQPVGAGDLAIGHQHRGGAIGDLARVGRRDHARALGRGSRFQATPSSRGRGWRESPRRAASGLLAPSGIAPCGRHDLRVRALPAARRARAGGSRARTRRAHVTARKLPLLGDALGALTLVDELCLSNSAGLRTSSRAAPSRPRLISRNIGTRDMFSTPQPMA